MKATKKRLKKVLILLFVIAIITVLILESKTITSTIAGTIPEEMVSNQSVDEVNPSAEIVEISGNKAEVEPGGTFDVYVTLVDSSIGWSVMFTKQNEEFISGDETVPTVPENQSGAAGMIYLLQIAAEADMLTYLSETEIARKRYTVSESAAIGSEITINVVADISKTSTTYDSAEGNITVEVVAPAEELKGTVTCNPTILTNGNVMATMTTNKEIKTPEGWTRVNATTYTKIYESNISEDIEIEDLNGEKATVELEIGNIDKILPIGEIEYSTEELTNQSIKVTLAPSEDILTPIGWIKVNESEYTKIYDENVNENIEIEDLAGNKGSVQITITNIDKDVPTAIIEYDTKLPTNGNVVATLTPSEDILTPVGWTKVSETEYTKTYENNIAEVIELEDLVGNKGSVSIAINNIDRGQPTGEVECSTDLPTNKEVTVIITTNKEIKTPEGWTKENSTTYTKKYSENITEDVEIEDLAGNSGTVGIIIANIDKDVPTAIVNYNKDTLTNENVKAELITSEEVTTPEGWTKIDATHYEKTYENNMNEVIILRDRAGNTGSVQVIIINIDKTAPIGEVEYSTISPTNENVLITITTNKEIVTPEDWTKVNETTYTKIYEENTNEILFIKDAAGNMGSVNIKITNVDKTTPTGTVEYSIEEITKENVKAIIETSEEVKTPDGWTQVDTTHYEKTYKENITETITLEDAAGNKGSIEITISNIDRTVPTATVEYSTEEATDTDVKVTLITSEEIKTPDGWTKVNETEYIKVFDNNAAEIVELEDMAGNKGTISVIVNNIDRGQPTGIIIYYTTLPINGDVLVTMLTNKEIATPDGWTRINTQKYERYYSENITEQIEIEDLEGIKGTVGITINNIDKAAPSGEVEYSTELPTNQSVKATITTSEEIVTPEGWTKIDVTHYEKEYTINSTETVIIKDIAGNEGNVTVTVSNIDKILPTGIVGYSTGLPTNEDVTVTITTSEEIKIPAGWTQADLTHYEKNYTSNVNETVVLEDLAGNKGSVIVTISNIDKSKLTGIVGYSTQLPTNQSIKATITTNKEIVTPEGWTQVNGTTYEKTYGANVNEIIEIQDLSGNKTTLTIAVNNIDKTAPTGTVVYNPSTPTNGNVTATIEASEEIVQPAGWTKVDATHYEKTYLINTDEEITIKDLAGNTGSVQVTIINIDKIAPAVTVSYSTILPTNENVTVTITTSEEIKTPADWTKIDETNYEKTYETNTNETIEIEDLVGNKGNVKIDINNIDKGMLTGTVVYNPSTPTNGNVTVTITTNKEIVTPTDWIKIDATHYEKEYEENANDILEIEDLNGKKATVNIKVTNIDRVAPTGKVSYDVTELTNGKVVVTIEASEEIILPSWTKADSTHYTKMYEENVEETVVIKDIAGNSGSVEVKITNIDKTVPTGEVSYNPKEPTNGNVTVTIETNEAIQTPDGWKKLSETTYEKLYTQNINEAVEIKDIAGNTGSVQVTIKNIDKTIPTGTVKYSKTEMTPENIIATIEASEEIIIPSGWTKIDAAHYEKEYDDNINEDIEIEDLVGNKGKVNVTINNIDKGMLTGTVGYNPSTPTNGNVTVTITTNKEIVTPDGWTKVDGKHFTKVYEENTKETVLLENIEEETFTVNVEVTNIDRIAPTGTVKYNKTTATNESITVILTTNEEIKIPANWTKIDDKHYTKEYDDNVNEHVEIEDLAGNTGSVQVIIINIDKTAPTGEVNYSTTELTNGKVVATIEASEEIITPSGWIKTDETHYTKTYEENTDETVELEDAVGNTGSVDVKITNIDTILPTAEVSYDITELTDKDVVVTIETSEEIVTPDGWTKTDETHYTKTYTENTEETIEIEDLAGNKENVNIVIENIDKKLLIGKASYSTIEPTNGNVTTTIETNREIITPEGWTKTDETHYIKVYTKNVKETVQIEDSEGITSNVEVEITNIDKEKPTAKVTYKEYETYVIATIETSEEIKTPDGWIQENKTKYTKVYKENKAEKIEIEDLAGNKNEVTVSITQLRDDTSKKVLTYNNYIVEGLGDIIFDSTYALKVEKKILSQYEIEEHNKKIGNVISGNGLIEVFEITITKNGITVSEFKDGIKIKIPSGNYSKYSEIKVVHVGTNGVYTQMTTTTSNEYVEFITTHLSEYAVTGRTSNNNNTNNSTNNTISNNKIYDQTSTGSKTDDSYYNPKTGDINLIIIIASSLVAITVIAVCIKKFNKNKN